MRLDVIGNSGRRYDTIRKTHAAQRVLLQLTACAPGPAVGSVEASDNGVRFPDQRLALASPFRRSAKMHVIARNFENSFLRALQSPPACGAGVMFRSHPRIRARRAASRNRLRCRIAWSHRLPELLSQISPSTIVYGAPRNAGGRPHRRIPCGKVESA
jgi:hypothetical protein